MSAGMAYRFKEAAHLPAGLDPQAVGERLAHLRESEGAGFTPKRAVDDARAPSSPLHGAFTWDDGDAAEKYRIQEAAYLIRVVVVSYRDEGRDEDREVRAFVPVTVRGVDESRFLSIVEVVSDEDYRRQHIQRLLGELLAIRRKGNDFNEFARVWRAIDRAERDFAAA